MKEGKRFLLTTHKYPDPDAIGSMLALGKVLLNSKKDVVLLTNDPVLAPLNLLKGAERIVQRFDSKKDFDAVVVLDCGDLARLGSSFRFVNGRKPLINIDHHESNNHFGNVNLIDPNSSSTGELVFKVIKTAGFPMSSDVAENIFAAIQADTGSFKYSNTTPASLRIAAEMMEYGAKPWELSRRVIDGYGLSRLRLLEIALRSVEFHHKGKIGVMILSLEMFERAQAQQTDGERFVDYPRFVAGVEIAVLIRQRDKNDYKFSLRSNGQVNVGRLASRFGGGGHSNAAGFECQGSIEILKENFLKEAARFLDATPN